MDLESTQELVSSINDLSVHINSTLDVLVQRTASVDTFRQTAFTQLRRGYVPSSPTELGQISVMAKKAPQILTALEEPFEQMQHAFRTLDTLKKSTADALGYANTLLSPIRKLPSEILIEIFHNCIFSDDTTSGQYALRTSEPRFWRIFDHDRRINCPSLHLTWICSLWRNVMRSVPTFWSSFYINGAAGMSENTLLLCQEYLNLSKDAPLKIHIARRWGPSGSPSGWDQEDDDLLEILLTHSERWHDVVLDVNVEWLSRANDELGFSDTMIPDDGESSQSSHSSVHSPFPNLQRLQLEESPTYSGRRLDLFTYCPNLEAYISPEDIMDWHDFSMHDFSKLTSLVLQSLKGKTMASFLCRLPLLKTFSLDSFKEEEDGESLANGFSHDALSTLQITTQCIRPGIWKGLSLPRLSSFELRHNVFLKLPQNKIRIMSSTLRESGCTLYSIGFYSIPHLSVFRFLQTHLSVSDLTLCGISLELFKTLGGLHFPPNVVAGTLQSGTTIVAPNLRKVTVELQRFSQFPKNNKWFSNFMDYVESKAAAAESTSGEDAVQVSRLEELKFNVKIPDRNCQNINNKDHRQMKDIKDRLALCGVHFSAYWRGTLLE